MNTGAEGVETAIKLARKWGYITKGIPKNEAVIIAFENNFHGRTYGAISLSTDPQSKNGFGPFIPGLGPSYDLIVPYDDLNALIEKVEQIGANLIAGILVEPIQGEAGIVVPKDGFLRGISDICKQNNILFIVDEVQTGLGRTGFLLASEYEKVRPDMVILGKALSGGVYPVSAVLSDKHIMLTIKAGEHGSTYGGNPLACAVAIEALDVLVEERLCEKAASLGKLFRELVLKLRHPLIVDVRGRGLLNAIVLPDSIESEKGSKTAWHLCLLLARYGLLTKPTHDNIVRLSPPLCISEAQIRDAVSILKRALDDISNWDIDIEPHGPNPLN